MKSLSPLVLLAFLSTMLVACCSAVPVPSAPATYFDPRTPAERAEAMSVALLDEDGNPDCGGVWVSRHQIVTKYHCIRDTGRPAILGIAEALGVTIEGVPAWSPVGQSVKYANKAGDHFPALIQAVDPDEDLALLNVLLNPPEHDIAFVSDRTLHDGETLDVVGSTAGEPFTYSRCFVASERLDWLQVSGSVYLGNSGGGAFDEQGHLVGLADHMRGSANGIVPGMSFFTPGSAIREFITKADAP